MEILNTILASKHDDIFNKEYTYFSDLESLYNFDQSDYFKSMWSFEMRILWKQ